MEGQFLVPGVRGHDEGVDFKYRRHVLGSGQIVADSSVSLASRNVRFS